MAEKIPVSERVQSAFRKLTVSASNLNSASDDLRVVINELDDALRKLNLGVSAWVKIAGDDDGRDEYWSRDLGYTRIGRTWGIALREVEGNYNWPDEAKVESWPFNDAPRWLRADAVGKIPDLLEKLADQADGTTKRIKQKATEARELTTAINAAAATRSGAQAK
jgi:hypothetical protein